MGVATEPAARMNAPTGDNVYKRATRASLAVILALLFAAPAWAQAPEAASGVVRYDQAFFARYDVKTAEDMLRRIPGAMAVIDAGRDNQQARGFGSSGAQVLINGGRFPGKSNEITTALRRLPSSKVERVELIRGAEGLEVRSEGVVINLVLKAGETLGGEGAWEANARFNEEGSFGVDGLLAYSGSIGALSYQVGIERNLWSPPSAGGARWTYRFRDEVYLYPDARVLEVRPQDWDREHDKFIYTGSLAYAFDNGAEAQLNGLFETRYTQEIDDTPFTRFSPTGTPILTARELHVRDVDVNKELEIGGEFKTPWGPGEATALFIVRRTESPTVDYRTRQEPTALVEVSRSESLVELGEDIVRAWYTLPLGGGRSIEVGAEAARNTLDQELDAFFDVNRDGRLEAIVIPTANAHVEELRGELFATLKWGFGPNLSVETSLNYEASRLSNNYPFSPERSLGFVKPRLDARYRRGGDQYRLLIERTVSQLDFANFVPRYNVVDDKIDAGNPGLEPEKVWTLEVGWERRLPRDGGVIEARAFAQHITDAIDKVPFIDQAGDLVSAQGNIPEARFYGIEAKASVRLGAIGLPDAVLTAQATRNWTSVADPFTGQDRRLKSDRVWGGQLGFRNDDTARNLSYGFTMKAFGVEAITSDLTVLEFFKVDPTLEIFVERRVFGGRTLRIEAQNLTGSREHRRRTLYATTAMDGTVRRLERWRETRDLRVAVSLRGKF